MLTSEQIIEQTKNWIKEVVVGCNFCPFAANELKQNSVHYRVEFSSDLKTVLNSFLTELNRLDHDLQVVTSFLIFPHSFNKFDDYLVMVEMAEKLLKHNGYEGIYQVASFHPLYLFSNADEKDAANYTNRSVYPMLHLLRETSITKALENYKNPEQIPERNITFAREKGLIYMQMLRDACFSN